MKKYVYLFKLNAYLSPCKTSVGIISSNKPAFLNMLEKPPVPIIIGFSSLNASLIILVLISLKNANNFCFYKENETNI